MTLSVSLFRIASNGSFAGHSDTSHLDVALVGSNVHATLDHMEQVFLGFNDDITLLHGSDRGATMIFGGSNDHVHLGLAASYNLSVNGVSLDGVAGASANLVGLNSFHTNGTINIGGNFTFDQIGVDALQGNSSVDLKGGFVSMFFHDAMDYTLNGGSVVASENGHSMTLVHEATQMTIHDAAGDAFSYAQLVGVIQAHGGDFHG
jgi:hypothetical protein